MKNIVGIAFLILITANLSNAQDQIEKFVYTLKNILLAYAGNYADDLLNTKCPGVCLSQPLSNICRIVFNNAGCPSSRTCCVFFMQIELNLPNTTEATPLPVSQLTVNIPGDSTNTLKDKETSTEDDTTKTTNLPSTTYETTKVLELERKKNEISSVTNSSYVDSLPSDLVVPFQTVHTTEQSITTLPTTSDLQNSSGRECIGECVSGILYLLCHDIDTDASCPSEESCCLTPMATNVTTNSPTTTQ